MMTTIDDRIFFNLILDSWQFMMKYLTQFEMYLKGSIVWSLGYVAKLILLFDFYRSTKEIADIEFRSDRVISKLY